MAERQHDRLLGIDTVGLREWRAKDTSYNRYEATPYRALEKLFRRYKFNSNDEVVDFGCGRGRVAFAIHHRFHVPITGIEANDKTFDELLRNKSRYREKARHISAPLRFEFGLAEHYNIKPTENKFYLFNPFSGKIFKQVVENIHNSLRKHPRPAEVILYYPLEEYKTHLRKNSFVLINKLRVPDAVDKYDKFLIYRYKPRRDRVQEKLRTNTKAHTIRQPI